VIEETILRILGGTVNGLMISALGYAKNVTSETFDPGKFAQTCVVGAIVGGVGGEMGLSYADAQSWCASSGLIVIIEYIKKAIVRGLRREQK